jgi:hypothetical protein
MNLFEWQGIVTAIVALIRLAVAATDPHCFDPVLLLSPNFADPAFLQVIA